MKTNNEAINGIIQTDMPTSEKLWMWVTLCDTDKVFDTLKKNAMLAGVSITRVTPMDEFVYGILRIAEPHRFEGEE